MKKILIIIGTRPEAIKMAPIISALKKEELFSVKVVATAQHRELLDQVLSVFGICPDIDMNAMQKNQSLMLLTSKLFTGFGAIFEEEKPDVVLAQGDTTSVFVAAIAAFYLKIPFGHIEAGLRTLDIKNPFPEEFNRVVASKVATWHFAPTESSRKNLLREGVPDKSITVTGNTVIDALLSVVDRAISTPVLLDPEKKLILLTTHRRENFGAPLEQICLAVIALLKENSDIQFLFPVHPNPNVRKIVNELLGDNPQIFLCEPLEYLPFIAAMKRSYLIMTDSGGVQEEAPALSKPVLVLRNETERPEAVKAGVARLIGTDVEKIISAVQTLLDDKKVYLSMAKGVSPYGDGHAAKRIVKVLKEHFLKKVN